MSRDSDSAPGHEIAKATATSDKGEIGGRSDQRSGRLLAIDLRHQVCPRSATSGKSPMNSEHRSGLRRMAMWPNRRLIDLLKIEHPLVSAPWQALAPSNLRLRSLMRVRSVR
jgi:hypothetical protein